MRYTIMLFLYYDFIFFLSLSVSRFSGQNQCFIYLVLFFRMCSLLYIYYLSTDHRDGGEFNMAWIFTVYFNWKRLRLLLGVSLCSSLFLVFHTFHLYSESVDWNCKDHFMAVYNYPWKFSLWFLTAYII